MIKRAKGQKMTYKHYTENYRPNNKNSTKTGKDLV